MENIKNIIFQEIHNFVNEEYGKIDLNNMNLNDIVDFMVGFTNLTSYRKYFEKFVYNAYRYNKDQGVIDLFKDVTKHDIFQVRNGRYSFTPQVTPVGY